MMPPPGGARPDVAPRWGRSDAPDAARERLLDAAGDVVARKGVGAVTVADVAAAAGCTRGTVHRYFGDRDGLRRAFVERESRRVGRRIRERLRGVDDPRDLLVDGVLTAVDEVRRAPILASWFTPDSAAIAGRVALDAVAVDAIAAGWIDRVLAEADRRGRRRADVEPRVLAEATVRLVLSLLSAPGADAPAERRLVEAVLVPAVLTDPG